MPYILFLDDVRSPNAIYGDTKNSDWTIARTYDEFVRCIDTNGLPQFISFDHDLAEEHYLPEVDPKTYTEKTGYDCAKWLIEYCTKNQKHLPPSAVHSMNPVGRENIRHLLLHFSL